MFFSRFHPGLLALALLGAPAASRAADPHPVSIQDLCLMLRSGYTGAEVLQETAARPLLEPVTPDDEKALRAAGADGHLVDALKSSHQALSPAEAAAARQQQAEQEQRAAMTAITQAGQQPPKPAAGPPATPAAGGAAARGAIPPGGDPHYVENMLHGKLVSFHDERVQSAGAGAMEGKKLIAFYFSMFMSKAGLTFSNDLVQFYRRTVPQHPEFEVVLVSGDNSPFAMENLMRRAQMPWLAVAYNQLGQVPLVSRFVDHTGASRLMVVDNFGHIHADYHISMLSNNLPMVLPDLEKVIADPTKVSYMAPPNMRPPDPAGQ